MNTIKKASKKVYDWASSFIGEALEENEDKFYPTKLFELLNFKLNNTTKGLIMVTGLQGTGKTRLLHELRRTFPDALHIKWTPAWREKLQMFDAVREDYFRILDNTLEDIMEQENRAKHLMTLCKHFDISKDYEVMEKKIGKVRCRELKKEAMQNYLEDIKIFLVDLPDYQKKNLSSMNSDVSELQEFWESINKNESIIILTVQKELVMKNPHFFFGKCERFTLEPLSVDELVAAYKLNTKDTEMFDDASLQLLATLSRGIFRRFKKYIKLTIENNLDAQIPLSIENVNKAVTEKQVFDDMELELADVFTSQEKRLQAIKIIDYLRINSGTNVKTIAEDNCISETMAQNIVHKLSLYKYIKTKRGEGKSLLVTLLL